MNQSNQDEDNFIITLGDIASALRRGKSKILLGSLAFSLLLTSYALIRPVKYESEATFKEKSNRQAGIQNSSITAMLLSGLSPGSHSEAKVMMTSRKLQEQVIKSLSLQATIVEKRSSSRYLNNFRDNLLVETYYLRGWNKHPLPDLKPILTARNIEFGGEIPMSLTLAFDTETTFQVFDDLDQLIGHGKLDTPFSSGQFSVTLTRPSDATLAGKEFSLSLSPLASVAANLATNIDIEGAKDDPSLLKITYSNRDRHLAYRTINQLLFCYQGHLRTEHQRISNEQLTYLRSRKKEMRENLEEVVGEHAASISAEVSKAGFADAEKAMIFLSSQLQKTLERRSMLELELKRLENLRNRGEGSMSEFLSDQTPIVITHLLTQMEELKQQSDAIELALRHSPARNREDWQTAFQQQIADLDEIRDSAKEAQALLNSLEADQLPLPSVKLFDDPKYLVRTWKEQLDERESLWRTAPLSEKERTGEDKRQFKSQFLAYITNLIHFLEVSERTIQARLSHQQSSQFEFQGIDLVTARELYMEYSKELSKIEAQILQLQFIIDQLKDPAFEVSSLSTVVDDTVTNAMVNRASDYVLALQDETNHSQKERDRLKKELDIQKRFLDLHLQQTVQLSKLREGLIKDKIQSLQQSSLELIRQQVSILENQLANSIAAYTKNMEQESELIEEFQLELREEMAKLPAKWTSERLIEQEIKINSTMVEELTKLVESKNIADNLEMVQSAPVDLAIPATHPKRPKLFLFALLGAFLGAFLSTGALLAQLIRRGVPASVENLELAGVHVAGSVRKVKCQENTETLRRAIGHLCAPPPSAIGQSLAYINGNGQDVVEDIAILLNKRGDKVLLLDMSPQAHSGGGLFPFLEGEAETAEIVHQTFFDRLAAGGNSPYANELLRSEKFLTLLNKLKEEYDWIIGITDAALNSAETENLFQLFDHALVNVSTETLQELHHVVDWALHQPSARKSSFITTVG